MKTSKYLLVGGLMAMTLFSACDKDDDDDAQPANTTGELKLAISGLEDLGDDYQYEGWIIVDGKAVSAGIFNVDSEGSLSQTTFQLDRTQLSNASAYVLTIEPNPDNDPAPSQVHLVGGNFSGNGANLTVDHSSAIGSDFTAATGSYILATPTDGMNNNELSGVWWLDPSAGPSAGLDLPILPAGWEYEGWAVIDGTPVTTGKFTSATGADFAAPYSGSQSGPAFPGEDMLQNAPSGLTFPTDLSGKTVVISVEPKPDNSEKPFALKPLVGNVPASAADHTLYSMDNNAAATNPTGTATR